jgi:hypothetical protein
VRAHVELSLQPADRAALRALTPEEREAVLDELWVQVREDLSRDPRPASDRRETAQVLTSPPRR